MFQQKAMTATQPRSLDRDNRFHGHYAVPRSRSYSACDPIENQAKSAPLPPRAPGNGALPAPTRAVLLS